MTEKPEEIKTPCPHCGEQIKVFWTNRGLDYDRQRADWMFHNACWDEMLQKEKLEGETTDEDLNLNL